MKVKDMLDISNISNVNGKREMNHDKTCERSAHRPDFQVKHANDELVTIYVEVDENQHKSTDTACKLSRLNNLLTSFEMQLHLVVLR